MPRAAIAMTLLIALLASSATPARAQVEAPELDRSVRACSPVDGECLIVARVIVTYFGGQTFVFLCLDGTVSPAHGCQWLL